MYMIWCPKHMMPLEGELRVVKVDGEEYSFAFDTSEMWCQKHVEGEKDDCIETWQTIVTIDSH